MPQPTGTRIVEAEIPPEARRFVDGVWKTNFAIHSVPYNEIFSGGPPRDGIPPIDNPKYETVAQADAWLEDKEPVIFFELNGDARAYPLQILIWHEIVNDKVGSIPVAVTFCPLCNTALVFHSSVDGQALRFGTTGLLRFSDLVMWDNLSESWWQQATGEAIVGDLTGRRLTFLPASIISWADFKAARPEGKVLSRDTGHFRPYGENPYVGYDNINSSPFLYRGPQDGRLPPMERVVAVTIEETDVAYPFTVLAQEKVVNDTIEGQPIVVFYQPGTASALDAPLIAFGKDIGSAAVFDPTGDGRVLTFQATEEGFIDDQTGSLWNILGEAISGPLTGEKLSPIVHGDHFWFAWAVFKPDTVVYGI